MGARRVMQALVGAVLGGVAMFAIADRAHYDVVADYVGVPRDIFYAMALAESGRERDGQLAPWPWTLNVAGDAHFYPDRDAMFAALMAALQNGQLCVDVGPLQLNWYWQFERIASPWRMPSSPPRSLRNTLSGPVIGGWRWGTIPAPVRPRTWIGQQQRPIANG